MTKPIMCVACMIRVAVRKLGRGWVCQQCWTDWHKTNPPSGG